MANIKSNLPKHSKSLYDKAKTITASDFLNIDINDLSKLPRKELIGPMNRLVALANKRIENLHPSTSGANSPALIYLARQQGINLDRVKGYQKALQGVRQMRHEQIRDIKREIRERQKEHRGTKRLEKQLAKAEEYYKGVIKGLQKDIKANLPRFSTKGKSVNELRALYSDIRSFMKAQTSTQEGFEAYRERVAEELGDFITSDVDIETSFWDAFHRYLDSESDFVYEKEETNKVLNWFSVAVEQSGARTTDQMYELLKSYSREQIDNERKWQEVNINGQSFDPRNVDFYKR